MSGSFGITYKQL
jgi:hypothetical protein